jgi:1,4-dihydroxy-2-naphthoyl-CoA synthase
MHELSLRFRFHKEYGSKLSYSNRFNSAERMKGVLMEFQTIHMLVRDGIGIITLNRLDNRNAISIQMRRDISACLGEWGDSEKVNTVIFTGSGGTFSAGFDLKEFGKPSLFDELYLTSSRYHRDVWHFPRPTIAAVNGPAMAGGFDPAAICDIRICSPSAVFGHPEIKFGAPSACQGKYWKPPFPPSSSLRGTLRTMPTAGSRSRSVSSTITRSRNSY